ncbi:chaperone NapD [Sulfurimonas sp. HSL-1716]|uniref:chaperone NapD n=1 Tax=Hydrocurvibacter sulfurireducens TaxID=3131937 RepID=UPI0031F873E8
MNVSSIVVQTVPKYLDEVLESLKNCGVCDYHIHDEKGRIVVTIEGESVSDELKKLRVIEELPHVIAADMHMSYSEEELERHMKVIEDGEVVPKVLDNEIVDPSQIVYNGDLKKKDLEAFAKTFDTTER